VYHPQSNRAIERANGLIFSGIKKCLFDQKKGKWVDELPKVICSHNTTVSRATGFTPFRLLFDTEAMTPEEIKNESMRVLKAKEIEDVDHKVEKDMIELTILEAAENIDVTPSFKGKTECIDHVCTRIKLHTHLDIVNTKISATRIKSYYKP
jgi:hypothetical protein